MRVLSCLCCDGICGPQHGCNCTPCQKLDEEETARTTAIVEKSMSAKRIMDSWVWGPQPCKYIYMMFYFLFVSNYLNSNLSFYLNYYLSTKIYGKQTFLNYGFYVYFIFIINKYKYFEFYCLHEISVLQIIYYIFIYTCMHK